MAVHFDNNQVGNKPFFQQKSVLDGEIFVFALTQKLGLSLISLHRTRSIPTGSIRYKCQDWMWVWILYVTQYIKWAAATADVLLNHYVFTRHENVLSLSTLLVLPGQFYEYSLAKTSNVLRFLVPFGTLLGQILHLPLSCCSFYFPCRNIFDHHVSFLLLWRSLNTLICM